MPPTHATGRYTLLSHGHVRDHSWSVHAPGCPDIARDATEHDSVIEEDVQLTLDDDESLILAVDVDQLGYTADAVRVHACARAVQPAAAADSRNDSRGEVS